MSTDIVLEYPWENEHYYFRRHYRVMLFERILDQAQPGTLLDCGTGSAIFLKVMAEKGWEAYGFDGRITTEKNLYPGVHLVNFRFDPSKPALPFAGVKFDLITAGGFVDYLPALDGFFDQAVLTLNPKGILLISAINGLHQESCNYPGHPLWQVHQPEIIADEILRRFKSLQLFLVRAFDSRELTIEEQIVTQALESRVQIQVAKEVSRLLNSTPEVQQCVFLTGAPR